MEMKFCPACARHLSAIEYASHPATWDRLQRICKECDRKRFKEYYIKNKNKVLEKNKNWIKNNRERHNIIARKCVEKANSRNSYKESD